VRLSMLDTTLVPIQWRIKLFKTMKKLLPVFLLLVLFSCLGKKDKVAETIESLTFENERNNFLSQMKTAKNAAAEIQATGADFNESLLSNPSSYLQYTSDTIKSAANLGVYLSDLNYCVMYGRSELAGKLFSSAIELSKVLGVDKNVLEFLMTRYYENISQNDSLMNVVNELFEKSATALKETEKRRQLGVIMAAYQIETLYLALGIIETYPKDILPEDMRIQVLTPLFKMVLGQQKSIEITHTFLRTLRDAADPNRTPNFAYYDQAFYELIGVYERLNVQDAIANNRGSELLNDNVVNELSEKVSAIRHEIVSI
jgi:hypothetical protein